MQPLYRGAKHPDPITYQPLIGLIKMRLPYSDPRLLQWLKIEIDACLPFNLMDANRLFFHIGKDYFTKDSLRELRQNFVLSARKHFEAMNAEKFSNCFVQAYPYTLSHLIRIDRKEYPAEFLANPADWKWLRDLLVGGMIECPQVLVPQVMIAFGEYGPGGEMPTWFKYDEEGLQEMFGNRFCEALSLMSQDINYASDIEGWFKLTGPLGSKEAQRLWEEKCSSK